MTVRMGNAIIAGSNDIDDNSITTNNLNKIQATGVIDQNSGLTAIKSWVGTLAEYNALSNAGLIDNNTLYNITDDYEAVVPGGLEIGDIGIAPLGIDETKNKRRYLNGQVISQTQFAEFATKIKNAIALYPALGATEVNWQAEVTNSDLGQCGKFVVDDNAGTIRLPKVVNINGLQNLAYLGEIKEAGLPNITGEFSSPRYGYYDDENINTGAFTKSYKSSMTRASADGTGGIVLKFDASDSNSIYGNSSTVQQEAIQYPYFIQVATGVEEDVDISTEIQLNNPFSLLDYKYSEYELSNASWLLSNGQYNSGATYQAVYNLLLQELNGTSNRLPYKSYINTVGNLIDTDGVLSGFSTSIYATLPKNFAPVNNTWEMVFKVTTGNDVSTNEQDIFSQGALSLLLRIQSGNLIVYLSSNNSNWDIASASTLFGVSANTTYLIKLTFTGSTYASYYSTDGGNTWTSGNTITSSTAIYSTSPSLQYIGRNRSANAPFLGTIDLNESYININGEHWWTGRRKIITSAGDYDDTDFVLNTGDTTFRLPLYTQRVLVKKYVSGTDWYNLYSDGWCEQGGVTAAVTNTNTTINLLKTCTDTNYELLISPMSTNADAHGIVTITNKTTASVTVQCFDQTNGSRAISASWQAYGYCNPPSVSEYTEVKGLYFYVGETIQDANIIAASQALTDIANLKAHYITETYVNGTSWYRVYSDGWCEQGGYAFRGSEGWLTISLLKNFVDTNYNASVTPYSTNTSTYMAHEVKDKTISDFAAYMIVAVDWRACGYIS